MDEIQMIEDLHDLVISEVIHNDDCKHDNPADAEPFCAVCFIINLYI